MAPVTEGRLNKVCVSPSVFNQCQGWEETEGESKSMRSADVTKSPVLLDPHFLQGLCHYSRSLPSVTLEDIVFWYRTDHPRFVGILGEIRYLGSVTAMHEQFWRPISCVFRRWFLSTFTQISGIQSAISTTGSQNSLILRWPLSLECFILMWFKGMQLKFQIYQIPTVLSADLVVRLNTL